MQSLRLLSTQCRAPLVSQLGSGGSLPSFTQLRVKTPEGPIGARSKTTKASKSVDHRVPIPCGTQLPPKPCFDKMSVLLERGTACHEKLIRSFLMTHYWPREPSCTGLWMPLDSPLISVLTEKYCTSGDRFLAFEHIERTDERRLIGVLVAYKTFEWVADELEEWALHTALKPEQHRIFFMAHCLRSPNLFKKYNTDYIYDLEVLVTSADVGGHGVATALVKYALDSAIELRFPLTQLVAKNVYACKCCTRAGMKRDWTMDYSEFVDNAGRSVFYPRKPHYTVNIFTKKFVMK